MDLINCGDIFFINNSYESAVECYEKALEQFENLSFVSKFRLLSHRLGAYIQLFTQNKKLDDSLNDYLDQELSHLDLSRLKRAVEDARNFENERNNPCFLSTQHEISLSSHVSSQTNSIDLLDGEVEMFHSRMAHSYIVLKQYRESLRQWEQAIKASHS